VMIGERAKRTQEHFAGRISILKHKPEQSKSEITIRRGKMTNDE
jgi:hypothetical protein